MNSRLIASVALGAAVVLGATGCSMISPQATTIEYAPSDGVTVGPTGPLQLRNVLIVAGEDGSDGNLIAAIVNATAEPQTLRIDIRDGEITERLRVPANTTLSLGAPGTEPLLLEGIDSDPGTNLDVYFESGDQGSQTAVPVLDGELDYLSDFVPETAARR